MKKSEKLTQAEIAKRVDEAWHNILAENGLVWSPAELREMLKTVHLPPEAHLARGLTMGAAIGLSSVGKKIAAKIRSRAQLDKILFEMRQAGDKIPALLRRSVKEMARTLPRKGGPGRQPKLNAKEASQMCDQIAILIRQKSTLKQALQKASELSPSILGGKKVSPRTLQKAWGRRDEFTTQ
jgi:hypothetical protein